MSRTINISEEDYCFLKALQKEMLTQDTCCQASPRYWSIKDYYKEYWVEENTDGFFIYNIDDNDGQDFEDINSDLAEWLKDLDGVKNLFYEDYCIKFKFKDENIIINEVSDLSNFLEENFENTYEIGFYREFGKIVENTMFLTLKECQNHLKENSHHYSKNAHTYAMTAWRSPQVKKLFEILENIEFE